MSDLAVLALAMKVTVVGLWLGIVICGVVSYVGHRRERSRSTAPKWACPSCLGPGGEYHACGDCPWCSCRKPLPVAKIALTRSQHG